ncbi:MAG: septum formation protein Maf [Bacteroidaceae bacterium]|nr:septum formation protein Maf [Bacteroidaceae bacterium]
MGYKLILASGSPRRRELLAGLGLDFEVRVLQGIDERVPDGLSARATARAIAEKKAEAYRDSVGEEELVITADTIVWLDGQVLGKPRDEREARRMLQMLRGRTHQVVTGVTLQTREKRQTFDCVSDVTFGDITDREIDYYVSNYKPLDKAGAYGIQEWIGYVGVERIEGSYFNVMGLPVQRLYQALKTFEI